MSSILTKFVDMKYQKIYTKSTVWIDTTFNKKLQYKKLFNGRFSDYQKRSNKLSLTLKISNWRTRSLNFIACICIKNQTPKKYERKYLKKNIKLNRFKDITISGILTELYTTDVKKYWNQFFLSTKYLRLHFLLYS